MPRLSIAMLVCLSLSACAPAGIGTTQSSDTQVEEMPFSRPAMIGGAVVLSSLALLLARNTTTVGTR